MTSEEESEDERVPNHLVAVCSLTYQATHKKLLASITLDPTREDFEAQECDHALLKLRKTCWEEGPLPLSVTEKPMAPNDWWRLLVWVVWLRQAPLGAFCIVLA